MLAKQQQQKGNRDDNRSQGITKDAGKNKSMKGEYSRLSTKMWETLFAYDMKRFHHPSIRGRIYKQS